MVHYSEARHFSVLFTVVILYTGMFATTLTIALVDVLYVAELAVRRIITIPALANMDCLERWALSLVPSS